MEISNVLYYQLNIDTIIEKYCINKERPKLNCNGKCYLMTQMKMSNNTPETNQPNALTVIVEAFIPLFFQDTTIQIKNNNSLIREYQLNWKPTHLHTESISITIDHPPESNLS